MPIREAVVIEAHWPIYEDAWDMVQRLAEGRPHKLDEMEALLQDAMAENIRLRVFIKKWRDMRGIPLDLLDDYMRAIK